MFWYESCDIAQLLRLDLRGSQRAKDHTSIGQSGPGKKYWATLGQLVAPECRRRLEGFEIPWMGLIDVARSLQRAA